VPLPDRDEVLVTRGLTGARISALDIDVRGGELVGVASAEPGEAARVLGLVFGSVPRREGTISIRGRELARSSGPAESCRAGMQFVDDRLVCSIPSFTVRENVTVGRLREISGRWRLKRGSEKAVAAELIQAFGIVPANGESVFAGLSGGNQQKGVLARALSSQPHLLLLDDPTRGVDVGAKTAIYRILRDAAERGMAALMCSSDFEELAALCHRVIVLRNGRVVGTLGGPELTAEALLERCYVGSESSVSA